MTAIASWPITYHVDGESPGLAHAFSGLLRSCGFVPSTDERASIKILLRSASARRQMDSRLKPVVEWGDLQIRRKTGSFLFSYKSWDLSLDLATLTMVCSGPDPAPDEHLTFRDFFLISPFLYVVHRLGYFELHAAACSYQESGYLLLGPSGTGKTSAVLALIASGWQYLSDDAIILAKDSVSGILARPLRRSFSVKPDHLARHPELEGCTMEPVPDSNKRRFDPRELWPDQYNSAAIPKFIVTCSLSDEEYSRIMPISRTESLARLVASSPWLMLDRATASSHLETFRSAAANCYSFQLKAGRDLFHDRKRLASLLAPEVLTEKWRSATKGETWA